MCRNLHSAFLSVIKQIYGHCRNSKPKFAKNECFFSLPSRRGLLYSLSVCHTIGIFFSIIRVECYIQNKPELLVCVNVLDHKDSLIHTAFLVLFLTNTARLVMCMLFHSYVSVYDILLFYLILSLYLCYRYRYPLRFLFVLMLFCLCICFQHLTPPFFVWLDPSYSGTKY
jgi:hypothetical protein